MRPLPPISASVNTTQLTSATPCRYDVFKNGLLRAKLLDDGLGLHFASSFLAVSSPIFSAKPLGVNVRMGVEY